MKKLFLLLLLAPSLYAQNAASSAQPVNLTDDKEIKIGYILAKKWEQAEGMAPTPQSDALDKYLQTIGDRVAAHAQRKLPYHFHFDANPDFKSAAGLPGGQIFVGAGILAYVDTEDQIAGVLGHEIEHIALNQCRDRLIKIMTEQHLSARDGEKLKIEPFLPGYGHDNEFAADREGVKLSMEAGYSGESLIRLLQTYIVLGEMQPNSPKEAKSNLEDRIAQIKVVTAESKLPKPAAEKPINWP
jgi:predicted Zn-dependent protease